jgi:hypothetical protein
LCQAEKMVLNGCYSLQVITNYQCHWQNPYRTECILGK